MGKILIIIGSVLIIAGLIIHFSGKSQILGNLPGDFKFERGNLKVYLPIMTSLLISAAVSIILFIVQKLKG